MDKVTTNFQTTVQKDANYFSVMRYAAKSKHVTVTGYGDGSMLEAAIVARPDEIHLYDENLLNMQITKEEYPGKFAYNCINHLQAEIAVTDCLILNTVPEGNVKYVELTRHAPQVRKYIIVPNTTKYRQSTPQELRMPDGVKPVGQVFGINHWLQENDDWHILECSDDNTGLTVFYKK
jgi:hypothetical protein